MKLEQYMLDNILYIGNELPEVFNTDTRNKFILLGTPQEMIDTVTDIDYSKIEQEFQDWVDAGLWEGEDKYTKNFAVGNVTQWWINKIKKEIN